METNQRTKFYALIMAFILLATNLSFVSINASLLYAADKSFTQNNLDFEEKPDVDFATNDDSPVASIINPSENQSDDENDYYDMANEFSTVTSNGSIWKYQYVTHNGNDYTPLPHLAPDNTWRDSVHSDSWWFGVVGDTFMHPAVSANVDTAVTFVAPKSGIVKISSSVPVKLLTNQGNGINIKINNNDDKIWPKGSDWKFVSQHNQYDFEAFGTSVEAGDQIHFIFNDAGWGNNDSFEWKPILEYVDFAISDYSLRMYPNSGYKISAFSSSSDINWTSSDSSKATVDENGYISATGFGQVTITASDGLSQSECVVNIVKPDITTYPLSFGVTEAGDTRISFNSINSMTLPLDYSPEYIFEVYNGSGEVLGKRIITDEKLIPGQENIVFADFPTPDNAQNPVVKLYICDDYEENLPSQVLELGLWKDYASAITNSTSSSLLTTYDSESYTWRTYVKPVKDFGEQDWRFYFSNYEDYSGGISLGSEWTIREAFIADGGSGNPNGSIVAGTSVPVTYGGKTSKVVLPGEQFWSDEIKFNLPVGNYLCFSWTIAPLDPPTARVPLCYETLAPSFAKTNGNYAAQESNDGWRDNNSWGVVPGFFAVKKDVDKKMSFIGNSITQGIGTTKGKDASWVGQIARGFEKHEATKNIAVFNVGIGGAQANGAANDGAWLSKVKHDDEITLVLGVNDLGAGRPSDEIIGYIKKMIASIRLANPTAIITLFTIPPFDYNPTALTHWKALNAFILSKPEGVDYVFDMAIILEDPDAEGRVLDIYRPWPGDGHPNDLGSAIVAEEYLEWYASRDTPAPIKDYYNMANDFSVRTSDGPVWKYQFVTHNEQNYQPMAGLAPAYENLSATWRQEGSIHSWGQGYVGEGAMHPGTANNWDTAITFVAPKNGFVKISAGGPIVFDKYSESGGVKLKVDKNTDTIWPRALDWKIYVPISAQDFGQADFNAMGMHVNAGEQLHFVVNQNGNGVNDNIRWNPVVEYVEFGLSDYVLDMYAGQEYKITTNSFNTVAWSSSDESTATVDSSGNITAVSGGKAVITAIDGDYEAMVEVNVIKPLVRTSPMSFGKTEDGKTRASINVSNDMDFDYISNIVFALYNNKGQMVDSKTVDPVTIEAGKDKVIYADFYADDVEGAVIKQFIYDNKFAPIQDARVAELGIWQEYGSAIANSTGNNLLSNFDGETTRTYRIYVKPTDDFNEQTWRFWYSNIQDASRGGYPVHEANRSGGNWNIESAYLADGGTSPNGSIVPGSLTPITYDGATTKKVVPEEQFWSDEVAFDLPQGNYLCFIWTITRVESGLVPIGVESLTNSFYKTGNFATQEDSSGWNHTGGFGATPNMYAVKKKVAKKMTFIGDSITQGVGTADGKDEYWVAKVAKAFASDERTKDISIWNNGLGWGRAYDGASDGAWLSKVKSSDEISLVLGVNDINLSRSSEDIINDIKEMVASIRLANPNALITLFTVPTYDFSGNAATTWRTINAFIRAYPEGVDYVFDVASVLSQPAPNDASVIPEYKTNPGDSHPGAVGCTAIANAYLQWFDNRDY